jgi:hypothetical protein
MTYAYNISSGRSTVPRTRKLKPRYRILEQNKKVKIKVINIIKIPDLAPFVSSYRRWKVYIYIEK